MEGKSLSASSQFDTFGFTAAEHSRKHAEKEQHERPSAIPGPVPDELVAPVSESIGVKLLLKMGWRRGHSIKEVRASSDARREARKAFLAFYTDENTKETPDSLVSETEVETSLGEDIKISESTPVSQFSCFSFQTSYMLLIVIATGVILLLVILFLNFSSTFY
jgi:G patch domain-containing protein 1